MFEAKNYENLIGLPGFSERLLRNHFTLYEAYVTNANKIMETIAGFQIDEKMATLEYAELKRRFGWEYDGMRLHELYFENIAKEKCVIDQDSQLYNKITEDFGSFDNFIKQFMATGAMRGIGWVVLYFDTKADKLIIAWINEHDTGHLAGCAPILVMDVFEHAFMIDYETKKASYIEAFMKVACWSVASDRFAEAK
ncbi:MAG TPA: Fe-Mn family superoxide dismutase [Candidatus Moranbacteria bacterium]|jgi:Fe-Mn family superoxide dismutase|nr:Fe-Mn family superoxide dismutase [Candidatus Moranbacteria bacterium]HQB59774.1 Fe-Mn family superoxide dismutase [Candidatus Moranbacteria bacterium]